jgi:hypothetical protein
MLRSVLSAVALAAILATVHPAFADPLEAMASDHSQAAAAATQQVTPVPASSGSSDTTAPASAKDFSPVGFGWG